MEYRKFGHTDLTVSAIGFGAWAIGGPAMAGNTPIGWGDVDDNQSRTAIHRALEQGITFFDTADFYGLGHSETLLGEEIGTRQDCVIATKVGHRLDASGNIYFDYSKKYILNACEQSLIRLRRDTIDFYQLHTARMPHLEQGECIEAMEQLREQGKIRYWGLSLNTFAPNPEGEFLLSRNLGQGFQLVLNILNQRAVPVMTKAANQGYGIIARMPLQFGLLSGKFTPQTRFAEDDHRHFRLPPPVLERTLAAMEPIWQIASDHGLTPVQLALSFILSFPEVSTVIPGIKTAAQADSNTTGLVQLPPAVMTRLQELFAGPFQQVMADFQQAG